MPPQSFINDDSGSDVDAPRPSKKTNGKRRAQVSDDEEDEDELMNQSRTKGASGAGGKKRKNGNAFAWEASYNRSWDVVQEDESGGLQAAVNGLLARGRKRRAQQNSSTSLRRSLIRHLHILLDLSPSTLQTDLRPSRFELTLSLLRSFVVDWFENNPLGQMGIIGLRAGVGEMICEMGGNPHSILDALKDKKKLEPAGEPSLVNGLEMARGSMAHLPSTASLEVLALFSSLTTTDPTSISRTLAHLISSRIRVSIIALAAELKICRVITEKTGGRFGVVLNESHYKDLMWEAVEAPAMTLPGTAGLKNVLAGVAARSSAGRDGSSAIQGNKKPPPSDLMMMGFPTRLPLATPESLCACHAQLKRGGYECPRCGSKVCEVPTDCEVCGLMVVSSPHLARSYWFLFPVPTYDTVPPPDATHQISKACFGCEVPFPDSTNRDLGVSHVDDGVSPTGRYRCPKCHSDFCMECDLYVHDVLHSCPGCTGL